MNKIESLSKELKQKVSVYSKESFLGKLNFIMQIHHKNRSEIIRDRKSSFYLSSPARQLTYLVSIYLSIEAHGNQKFEYEKQVEVFKLLNLIEKEYQNIFASEIESRKNEFDEEQFKKMLVTTSTFLDYFLNANLNYIEQDIERIVDTFSSYNTLIERRTGLRLEDFILFFNSTIEVSRTKELEWVDIVRSKLWKDTINEFPNVDQETFKLMFPDHYEDFFRYLENPSLYLGIQPNDLFGFQNSEHVLKLLEFFSIDSENSDFLYYTQSSSILKKPILKIGDIYYFFFHKYLSRSIYSFLFDLCKDIDGTSEKIYRKRDERLEKKAAKILNDFFVGDSKIFRNYMYNGEEKDLLVLYRGLALIVEVKASKKREPFRDIDKSYIRIRRDFKDCIQKGYDQTYPVRRAFNNRTEFEIQTEHGKYSINPRKYSNVFSIVVTEERLGQIQTDLGLLLELSEDDYYPWSVSIDDLEVFLLTLKRKKTKVSELIMFLRNRELLHERVVCSDELELCAYFFMSKKDFIEACNHDEIFVSSPDLSDFFDDIYHSGMGFEKEIYKSGKLSDHSLSGHRLAQMLCLRRIRG